MNPDTNKALALIQEGGAFSQSVKGFESRLQQQHMMADVLEAYQYNKISLIEAGTGTGKSLAYLIPALLWAVQKKERTLISTQTITLQEQLVEKDIPLVTKVLNLNVKAVLVKGMGNYVCLRKLDEVNQELLLLQPQHAEEIKKIMAWSDQTTEGSRSSLPFAPSGVVWEKVNAESDVCNQKECPYYEKCHFFKARRQAEDAQILVVNHHLLFADLAYRANTDSPIESGLLPDYKRVILDEAHHIEEVATDYFASNISYLVMLKILGKLGAEKDIKSAGRLKILREKVLNHFRYNNSAEATSLITALNVDLPAFHLEVIKYQTELFDTFTQFLDIVLPENTEEAYGGEQKLRIFPMHHTHPIWIERIVPQARLLVDTINRYEQSIKDVEQKLKQLDNEKLNEQTKAVRYEILALALRLENASSLINRFINELVSREKVRWVESQLLRTGRNTSLIEAELDISKPLAEYLFNKFPTIILCSATLSTNNQFTYIRQRLGLTFELLKQREVIERQYDSPFNYSKQALLGVPTDLPDPRETSFTDAAAEKIWQIVKASNGNAFVLFTSYSMLKSCYQRLHTRFEQHKYPCFKQGDDNRQSLLKKFKETDRSVLLGTDSFWEGVDVVGDALRCVIIVKLPFRVPTEPIIQARTEAISAKGGDPFAEYTLPQAIVKFKQGFGRLIRHQKDRGCIICLDTRLLSKKYGKLFLNSLPACQQTFAKSDLLLQNMSDFYRKTYYLVKK